MKQIKVIVANKIFYIKAQKINSQIWLQWEGRTYSIPVTEVVQTQKQLQSDKNRVLSPMPGKIVKILTTKGKKIQENQALLILSSMKMEYTLRSPGRGIIKSLKVTTGDQVRVDQELILLELSPVSEE